MDAELTIDDLDARDPRARGLIVLLYFVFVLALEDVELIMLRLLAIAVMVSSFSTTMCFMPISSGIMREASDLRSPACPVPDHGP
jgi:hypothetical protein